MEIYKTIITHREEIASNTLEVSLQRPNGFHFKAGQYLQIEVPFVSQKDHRGQSRIFSIVTSPSDRTKISVAFRRSSSGFKHSIENAPLGTEVILQGPYGYITLERELERPLVCIAGGIGITPCISMIRFATENRFSTPVTLVYANGTKESAAYISELEKISKKSKWLRLKTVTGLIDQQTLHGIAQDNPDSKWLVTGPPAMVDEVRNMLYFEDIDEHTIYYEEFQGY